MIEYAVLVALVIAFTKVIRLINKPNDETPVKYFDETFLPLIAVVLGIVLNALSGFAGSDIIISGLIAGLVAAGSWDVGKGSVEITKGIIEVSKK